MPPHSSPKNGGCGGAFLRSRPRSSSSIEGIFIRRTPEVRGESCFCPPTPPTADTKRACLARGESGRPGCATGHGLTFPHLSHRFHLISLKNGGRGGAFLKSTRGKPSSMKTMGHDRIAKSTVESCFCPPTPPILEFWHQLASEADQGRESPSAWLPPLMTPFASTMRSLPVMCSRRYGAQPLLLRFRIKGIRQCASSEENLAHSVFLVQPECQAQELDLSASGDLKHHAFEA